MQGQQVSHYRLIDKLGAGTHGDVWKGVHTQDDQLFVAVKVFHGVLASDGDFLTALKAECRVLSRLHHEHIVGFRELVIHDAHRPAIVLEYVEGGSLEDRLLDGPHDVAMVVGLLEAMLTGLVYAHGRGVVHRDIKPGNILLDDRERVRIADFGIARAADVGQATKTGVIQGTLDYLAPEVFHGQSATPRADLYALALVIWEMLAGKRACPDGPLAAKMGWHIGMGLPDVRTVRQDCPDWLATLVAAMGAKNAYARPESAVAALAQLRAGKVGAAAAAPPAAKETPLPKGPGTVTLHQEDLEEAATAGSGASALSAVSGSSSPSAGKKALPDASGERLTPSSTSTHAVEPVRSSVQLRKQEGVLREQVARLSVDAERAKKEALAYQKGRIGDERGSRASVSDRIDKHQSLKAKTDRVLERRAGVAAELETVQQELRVHARAEADRAAAQSGKAVDSAATKLAYDLIREPWPGAKAVKGVMGARRVALKKEGELFRNKFFRKSTQYGSFLHEGRHIEFELHQPRIVWAVVGLGVLTILFATFFNVIDVNVRVNGQLVFQQGYSYRFPGVRFRLQNGELVTIQEVTDRIFLVSMNDTYLGWLPMMRAKPTVDSATDE